MVRLREDELFDGRYVLGYSIFALRNMKPSPVILRRRVRFTLLVVISQLLLIALAAAWGVHLILIAQNGGVYTIEDNPWLLYGEITATNLIIIFAIVVLVLEFTRMSTRRQSDRGERQPRQTDRQPSDAGSEDHPPP